jgi:hypothetical protein
MPLGGTRQIIFGQFLHQRDWFASGECKKWFCLRNLSFIARQEERARALQIALSTNPITAKARARFMDMTNE